MRFTLGSAIVLCVVTPVSAQLVKECFGFRAHGLRKLKAVAPELRGSIVLAQDWLRRQQHEDGLWGEPSIDGSPQKGDRIELTALALLVFLSDRRGYDERAHRPDDPPGPANRERDDPPPEERR